MLCLNMYLNMRQRHSTYDNVPFASNVYKLSLLLQENDWTDSDSATSIQILKLEHVLVRDVRSSGKNDKLEAVRAKVRPHRVVHVLDAALRWASGDRSLSCDGSPPGPPLSGTCNLAPSAV
eukprot:TRINITY_DN2111_c1_g1_i3.p4 TRINITY_DN2111_c1_g1~~TRINITY_DN2111_c1_g1_i3.p4  ORF type:complete len:121 (+),score=3.94 TRINITY_DN2111_c1_g1_i3:179-541(+)